ncbi:MAG TPA: hypothetical protein PKN80_00885 [bacterium]|uniref:Glycosyl hydrolase-like 10 domain-containing protein n=1 Tax=candidate division TA06 bacterium ADurb.Bin417 TaxID=1852828 RepID=A0A1V5MK11_UNCT6|nr:MAG: hypothetical protein BWY73_00457 [candidate division TA06 bacterium ADurb.Bin417]HNQ34603.1 hypothetical protein [bacterium]HNS49271.1 hypothetical protein [bacterium]
MQRIMRTWILSLFLAGFFLSVLPGYAAGQVARAPGLGRYDEQYGYPAPKWFQELEVVDAVSSDPATAGKLEFSHPSGGFQAAKAGWYAAGNGWPNAGLETRQAWNAAGSRASAYQDNPMFGIIEHELGMKFVREHGITRTEDERGDTPRGELAIKIRWLPGQQGWPGKYVNKDGREARWNLYDPDGNWVWKWGFYPGRHITCVNLKEVQDAWKLAIRSLMELGYDGIMFDNYQKSPPCFGDKLGKHRHLFPDRTNAEVLDDLYWELYKVIKGYHPDRVMWANSQGLAPWRLVDGQLIEGFMHEVTDGSAAEVCAYVVKTARRYQEAVEHGKVMLYMPRVPESIPGDKEDRAFFAYVAARLGRYVLAWPAAGLDKINWLRLKQVRSGIVEVAEGVYLRAYERGVVVLNGTGQPRAVKLPLASKTLKAAGGLVDVRTEQAYPVKKGAAAIEVVVPAYSGRVYATKAAFDLARARRLPDKPGTHAAPLLPGLKVAPADVILQGPEAFRKWHQDNPDAKKYNLFDGPR